MTLKSRRTRMHHAILKEGVSHKLTKKREYRFSLNQGRIVGISIILLTVILGGSGIFNAVSSHSSPKQISKVDAEQPIWNDNLASNDLSGWKSLNSNFFTSIGGSSIALHPTATQSAVVISNVKVDVSIASSRELFLKFGFVLGGACPANGVNPLFGFFLTRFQSSNSTRQIPLNYDPRNDANVSLVGEISINNGTCGAVGLGLLQRNDNRTILQDFAGGSTGGSDFLQTGQGTINNNAGNFFNAFQIQLNYTGNTASPNSVSSLTWDTGASVTTQIFPPLTLNQYYVGLFELQNSASFSVDFLADNAFNLANNVDCRPVAGFGNPRTCMTISWNVPTISQPVVVPQTPDTSGFLGPVIRALVFILTLAAQYFIGFLSFIWSLIVPILAGLATIIGGALVAILNAFGGIFGDSNLGNQISSAFTNILTYLTNIFSVAVTLWANVTTMLLNALNFIVNGFTTFQNIIESFLLQLPSLMTNVFSPFLTELLHFFNNGAFTIQSILMVWYVMGVLMCWRDFDESESPIALILLVYMVFLLMLWLGTSNVINPINGAFAVNQYSLAFTNTKWLLWMMLPFGLYFFFNHGFKVAGEEGHRGHSTKRPTELEHFLQWLNITDKFVLGFFKGAYFFLDEAYSFVVELKQLLFGNRISPVTAAGTG